MQQHCHKACLCDCVVYFGAMCKSAEMNDIDNLAKKKELFITPRIVCIFFLFIQKEFKFKYVTY